MNCIKCGSENDNDAEYCENCGSSLRQVCAHCGSPLKPGVKFCKKCGNPTTKLSLSKEVEENLATLRKTAPLELQQKIRMASSKIDGERKPVTILFTDIVGSTAIAEKLDPEEWKEIVFCAHRHVSQAVYRYEGTIAQLLGDGVLAFFGAPITHEDDPVRAVRAALDIQNDIAEYARQIRGYVDDFQVRIGINTGMVVVTSVGSDLHMEYLAIGDAVNLAARLQSAAQPGTILLSENTARLVKAAFELQSLGEMAVKGRAGKINIFEVVELKEKPESRRGFEELVSPLVGRDNELIALKKSLDSLLAGHGQIVSVIGEAGIGKSRLVEEAQKLVMLETIQEKSSDVSNLHWIEGRALSYGQTLSFWTIIQLIKNDLGLSDGDPEPRVRVILRKRMNLLFDGQMNGTFPYLANLIGVRLEDEIAKNVQILDGETLKRQTLSAISIYFERMAKEQPTVLVFEDLHWADPSSLEALEQLLSITDRVPLMLLLLSRLEREHGSWFIKLKAETDFAHRYTEILLKSLSSNEQNQLVDNLLAIADLPDSVRHLVLERAEGNPFYLEEILRSLIDQGAILREGNKWRATRELTSITIPDTLLGVLLARIDRLQEDIRHTLQLASVIGKSFLYCLLEAIGEAEQQLDQHLSQLMRVDLVREKTRIPELEYMFKHSLTQEAAYNSILVERRREFHRRVGEALEGLFADRKEQFLGLLAHHFESAGDDPKAITYLTQAGDRARLTDEHTEAIGYYLRALELLSKLGDKRRAAQVWLKLGSIYNANFQFEAAHQANENAFDLQQKTRLLKQLDYETTPQQIRMCSSARNVTLDPGKANWEQDVFLILHLFSGLAKVNEELDVVPEVARSWQVLDGGKHYIFHLRDDMMWTDGTPVTAKDFEFAWKRNLDPALQSNTAQFLFDVVGAQDYYLGNDPNPDHIGVCAMDAHTLEVWLIEPVAYFPFIVTMSVTLPLPRTAIERFGETWWQAGHMISNGVYRLVEFDAEHGGVMERNPAYPGVYPGNARQVEWSTNFDRSEQLKAYGENQFDLVFMRGQKLPDYVPQKEILNDQAMCTYYLVFSHNTPPFDDLRVRKAFGLTLDRQVIFEQLGFPAAQGGLIPPGMPGHSPDIGLPFNIDLARQLMKDAGFPKGQGFPSIKGWVAGETLSKLFTEMCRQWQDHLGIEITFKKIYPSDISELIKAGTTSPFLMIGCGADYPDPDDFMRHSNAINWLHYLGWQDTNYDQFIEEAARTSDRAKRMAMYRKADRYLVAEQTLVLPLSYNLDIYILLVKSWVKNFQMNLLGHINLENIIIEDH